MEQLSNVYSACRRFPEKLMVFWSDDETRSGGYASVTLPVGAVMCIMEPVALCFGAHANRPKREQLQPHVSSSLESRRLKNSEKDL